MADFVAENEKSARDQLRDKILESGKAAFDPESSNQVRSAAHQEFQNLIDNSTAWSLLPILNAAIQPGAVPDFLRRPLMKILILLPLRTNGVRSTLEFVFAVHPSGTVTSEESAQAQKTGGNITTEALASATKLLSSVPLGVEPLDWFTGLRAQLLELMDGEAGEELTKVAAHVISFGILGRKAYGAPGAPGWEIFVTPILRKLKPTTRTKGTEETDGKTKADEDVIDLRKTMVLTDAAGVSLAMKRLSSLLLSSPSPGLCKRIVSQIVLELWCIASIPGVDEESDFAKILTQPARKLLGTFIRVASSKEVVNRLVKNLLYQGDSSNPDGPWKYNITPSSVEAVSCPLQGTDLPDILSLDWDTMGKKAGLLGSLVTEFCSDDEVSEIFLDLFEKWLQSKAQPKSKAKIVLVEEKEENPAALFNNLLEVMVLQALIEKAGEKLISKSSQLLDVVKQVLEADKSQPQGDEILSVALSLLNQIITAPSFKASSLTPDTMGVLRDALKRLSFQSDSPTAQTAQNLSLLLQYRDELDDDESSNLISDQRIEDRKAYGLAMSYITDADSPPPVKSEGLNMISRLVQQNSPVIDVQSLLVLLSKMISNSEDFLNMRAIKMFTQVSEKHPKTVCRELLDHYLDAKELVSTDTRLRFGEAILQVMQRLGEMFTGPAATEVCETLLSIASRRGMRKKTEQRQARQERKQQMRNKEAADAWGGEVLDMSDDMSKQERIDNELLAQIVQGWESKRGSEDVRMRASALSLFCTAMDTNLAGIGPALVEAAVDVCLKVLAWETEPEKAILRRAAVVLVLAFVKALDTAKRKRYSLGFGLTEESRRDIMHSLRYIEGTDNDGLVRQHARDVLESLENWQMISLLPEDKGQENLGGLAGIAGNPIEMAIRANQSSSINGRPRIEEVE
ncbi:hypothetical protein TD95_002085 [Thielaviopsis punctulata]|uniref:RNA polymerase II assembly factor Rtp1 C-terminal domain-containing protein n=1 Tax=Thielaviopsis punctulata TaxID=72032 RepID=A0A0F4ZK49_9PEZI|nr:hypothetical protein TD95_002085 [Thielaviopsis punctulata]